MILDEKLESGEVIYLDGAVGAEIDRFGAQMSSIAWCGLANKTHPDIVQKVHEAYIDAGVDILTTNTFASCGHVLEAAGCGDETVEINKQAVLHAKQAIEEKQPNRPIAIAGSMSNHVAWIPGTVFADPKYEPTPEKESDYYKEWADALAEGGCDFLIMEMMLDTYHSVKVIEAAVSTGLPVWIGISASRKTDGTMIGWDQPSEDGEIMPDDWEYSDKQPLEDIVSRLIELKPQVVGIMHSSVKSIHPGIDVVRELWDGPTMAYPEANGFDALAKKPLHVDPTLFADYCQDWVQSGIQIVGGCCGTTVYHTQAMTSRLNAMKS